MNSTKLIAELTAVVGTENVRETSISVLGAEVAHEISPEDAESFGRVLEVLGENHATATIRGGGTHDELGNALRPVTVSLSTRSLEGVEEFDEQDGVIRVRGGTRVAALRAQVESCGWGVALDAMGLSQSGDATVGGTLAAAAFGARRLGFGPPRDTVLGFGIVLPTGERTSCGARVVKNVTGYDLQKLYCGSFGSLGVIESAWLRLRPLPERVVSLVALVGAPSDPVGASLGLSVARRSTARCVALLDTTSAAELGLPTGEGEAGGAFVQVVEFAGPSSAVDEDVRWTRARCDVAPAPSGIVDSISALSSGAVARSEGERIVARFAMLPSAVSRCVSELAAQGARVVAHPGLGLVYASWFSAEGVLDARTIVRSVGDLATGVRARARFERLPLVWREDAGFDVFGKFERGELQLMRALKQKFDPSGVLNPGRPAGHL